MPCTHHTSKGRPCPIEPDRLDAAGNWVCHVHDPNGVFAKQKEAIRQDKKEERRQQRALWQAPKPIPATLTQHPALPSCSKTYVHAVADCPLSRSFHHG